MTFDTWRLLQKFSFGRGDADDLLGLARTIRLTAQICDLVQNHLKKKTSEEGSKTEGQEALNNLLNRLDLDQPNELAVKILEAIDEDNLSQKHQLEDDEAAAVAEMAETILNDEGEVSKGISKSSKSRRMEGERDKDSQINGDLWIMRPT